MPRVPLQADHAVPDPALSPTLDRAALGGWAVRLRAEAAEVREVAGDLRRHGDHAGLVGPAGDALQTLLDLRAGQLRHLGAGLDTTARALAAEAVRAGA